MLKSVLGGWVRELEEGMASNLPSLINPAPWGVLERCFPPPAIYQRKLPKLIKKDIYFIGIFIGYPNTCTYALLVVR